MPASITDIFSIRAASARYYSARLIATAPASRCASPRPGGDSAIRYDGDTIPMLILRGRASRGRLP